ncbi:uncharacterized protein LOC113216174 [Frankliniella occidentalis]|uniref:Uncharacterized protein LOC113216174 n=1 Tax=Frankliniella occidentalis TaxID=133901 RepID=A0A9C6WRY5_FRAOC|nr:uncharacterized protein LOC113216174 [Frankliniella occidentalis]
MADDESRKRAYSAAFNVNRELVQRRRIPSLSKDVPYLITKVASLPPHAEYGQGYQIHLRDVDKKMFFVILPSRIVGKIGVGNFAQYAEDITARRPPFLIFKGLDGNAFDVCIHPFSTEMVKLALRGERFVDEAAVEEVVDNFDWLDNIAAGPSHVEAVAPAPEDDELPAKKVCILFVFVFICAKMAVTIA